jgi:hypothetical protein
LISQLLAGDPLAFRGNVIWTLFQFRNFTETAGLRITPVKALRFDWKMNFTYSHVCPTYMPSKRLAIFFDRLSFSSLCACIDYEEGETRNIAHETSKENFAF